MQRLKGLRGREPEIPSSVDSTESDDAVQRVPAGFVALATSENSSRDSSADEHVNVGKLEKDEDERNQVQLPVSAQSGHRDKSSAARCAGTARKLSRNKKSRTSKEEDSDFQVLESQQSAHACDFVDGLASAEVLADVVVLAMRRADFSVENERRRVVGRHGVGVGADGGRLRQAGRVRACPTHHRRLFLVVPGGDENWPRPDDFAAMQPVHDGSGKLLFDFVETEASMKSLSKLRRCLTQDPRGLQNFLQKNPFCVDALLFFAEHLRSNQEHEQCFGMVRRAVYTLECNFGRGFSPFSSPPRVSLRLQDDLTWAGWTWLRGLSLYMQCLARQGMHRTALEVCKLLMASTLPRDPVHALLSFDHLCLRAKQYDLLAQVAAECFKQNIGDELPSLALSLPNFAFSLALAGVLKEGSALRLALVNVVCVSDVIGCAVGAITEAPTAPTAPALLMRALLIFPLVLRLLLSETGAILSSAPPGSPSQETWSELLARRPFVDADDFRHDQHGLSHSRVCASYAKQCASLWSPDLPMRWLHACAARLTSMHTSAVFAAELSNARVEWKTTTLCVEPALTIDLRELPQDCGEMSPLLTRAWQLRLQTDEQDSFFQGDRARRNEEALQPTISLHSPPLLVFFQSLLPWSELDTTGTQPCVKWADVVTGVVRASSGFLEGACDLFAFFRDVVCELTATYWKRLCEATK